MQQLKEWEGTFIKKKSERAHLKRRYNFVDKMLENEKSKSFSIALSMPNHMLELKPDKRLCHVN